MSDERFEKLFQRFQQLVRHLIRFGRNEDDAEELAQQAMYETWKRIDGIRPGAEWSYALRTADSRAINQATRTREMSALDENLEDESLSAESKVLSDEFQRRFAEAFNTLPLITQQIFILRRSGTSLAEIAVMLDIDYAAARSRFSRAARMLHEQLGDPPPGVQWLELGDDK